MSQMAPSFLEDALALAAKGWRVFPVIPRDKKPQIKEWQKHASTDPNIIHDWGCNAHVDHILPRRRGGQNDEENLRLTCVSCNTSKGAT